MTTRTPSHEARHPIQVAARRSGLTPHVIRAWERRYAAVSPHRSGTNRRLYTDGDVERLLLLRRVTRAGRRIGHVATLTLDELRAIAAEDRDADTRAGDARPLPIGSPASQSHVSTCLDAVERLDTVALDTALRGASVDLAPAALTERVLMPLMQSIGDRWQDGALRIAHEHMATAIVRSFVGTMINGRTPSAEKGPEIVVAAPAGQRHEFGALLVASAACTDGWNATCLGCDLPADDIAAAALIRGARVVALSIVYPADDPRLGTELITLRDRLGKDVTLIVGGQSAGAYRDVLREIGALEIADVRDLRDELRELRYGPPAS